MPRPSFETGPSAMSRLGWSAATREVEARQWRDGVWQFRGDQVVEEVPVALVYNEIPHVVVMATPADLDDFALGFSLTEELIRSPTDLIGVDTVRFSQGIELKIRVDAACQAGIEQRARRMTARTGCGLCGAEGIEAVLRSVRIVSGIEALSPEAVNRAVGALRARQPLNAESGAVHAAAWASADGTIALVREDVGRHNALDKLIGACVTAGIDPSTGFVLVTSRASYEMVQKAMMFGAGALVAVSGPTGLAIRLAEGASLTLIGFARDARFTCYSAPRRLG